MPYIILAIVWVVIGASVGYYESRRGHWKMLWLLGAMAGPIALPLARQLRIEESRAMPVVVRQRSGPYRPGVRVLAGIDGSEESFAAIDTVGQFLGERLADITLAAVVDFGTAEMPESELVPDGPWPARSAAEAALERAAGVIEAKLGYRPTSVILSGNPATALETHAAAEGFDALVVGCRGHGFTKHAVGSCASQLSRRSTVPVIMIPAENIDITDPVTPPASTRRSTAH